MFTRRLLVDLELSRRLEHAEGRSAADFAHARSELFPDVGATSQEIGGAIAIFDGPDSPVTQTFALGLHDPVTPSLMGNLESFFETRRARVFHEVSPVADDSARQLLTERGYRPIEFTNVMFQELPHSHEAGAERVDVRPIAPGDEAAWIETSMEGWSEFREYAAVMRALGEVGVRRKGARNYLAFLDGRPVATGTLALADGVALLAGASTIPSARRQGAQLALLNARLAEAATAGCDLAMMCAQPGSASQRNAERHGFRIAYTRVKWELVRS